MSDSVLCTHALSKPTWSREGAQSREASCPPILRRPPSASPTLLASFHMPESSRCHCPSLGPWYGPHQGQR